MVLEIEEGGGGSRKHLIVTVALGWKVLYCKARILGKIVFQGRQLRVHLRLPARAFTADLLIDEPGFNNLPRESQAKSCLRRTREKCMLSACAGVTRSPA